MRTKGIFCLRCRDSLYWKILTSLTLAPSHVIDSTGLRQREENSVHRNMSDFYREEAKYGPMDGNTA